MDDLTSVERLAQQTVLAQPELACVALAAVNMCGVGCEVDRREVAAEAGAGEKTTVAMVSSWDCLQVQNEKKSAESVHCGFDDFSPVRSLALESAAAV